MKLTKRIIALVIVLCTLGAMMIPGVSVSAAENDLIVNFSKATGDFAKLGLASGANLGLAANLDVVNNAYGNTIEWGIHATDTRALEVRTASLYLRMRQYANSTHSNLALKFKAPADGNFILNIGYYQYEAQSDTVGAYIIESEPLTNNNGTLRSKVGELRRNGDPLVSFPGSSATGTYDSGDKTVALKGGQEYLLILFSETANTATDSRDYFTGFSLIYDSPLESETQPTEPQPTEPQPTEPEPTEPEPTEPVVNKDLEVKFSEADGDFTKLGLAKDANITAATINAAYEAGTIKWGIHATDNRGLAVKMNSLWLRMRQYNNAPHANVALSFKAPADGNYILKVGYGQYSTQSTQVEAFVIPTPEEALTSNSGTLRTTVAKLSAENAAMITIPGNAATGTYDSGDKTVALTGGQEYLLILAATGTTGADYYDFFTGFSLIYDSAIVPDVPDPTYVAEVGGVKYADFNEALTNGQGAEVDLLDNVAVEGTLDLGTAVLDLNGKTLTATAVVGTVTDSTNGTGLIKTAKESIITTDADELPLWDSTEGFEGYRVFGYTFNSLKVTDDEDNVTGVDQKINFYSYAQEKLAADIENKNWNALKLTTDTDNLKNIKAAYEGKSLNWRYEMASYIGQFAEGKGNTLNSGDESISFTMIKNSWVAIRFRSPNDTGNMTVTLKTGNRASNGAIFDGYILKASDVYKGIDEQTLANYANEVAEDPDVAGDACTAMITAINNAVAGAEPVFTNCEVATTGGNTYVESYEFEALTDYILVMKTPNSGTSTQYVRITDFDITRAEKKGDARTFWSQLVFTNPAAYNLVAASDLKVGFRMDWNGEWKDFELDANTVNEWANEEATNADKDYGFYIRVSGFEGLNETGVLTGTPYIAVGSGRRDVTPLTFEFNN